MERDLYTIQNPIGSILRYLSDLKIQDNSARKIRLVKWMTDQSPSMVMTIPDIYDELKDEFECSLSFYDKIFQKLGWQPHYVMSVIKEKLNIIENFGLVSLKNDIYSITDLGAELFLKQTHQSYIDSISYVADFWKDRSVKFCREGKSGIGSGFFIDSNKIATCKHVYDELKEGLKIECESGLEYTLKNVHFHKNDKIDIVIIETNEKFASIPFQLGEDINLAERVLVFGYPPVPMTTQPFLICNLGEVSSKVDNYIEQVDYLILSCIVKPGNSGGPVINSFGQIVGIATQNIMERLTIGEMKEDEAIDWIKSMGYSSALPVKYLREIITCPNKT